MFGCQKRFEFQGGGCGQWRKASVKTSFFVDSYGGEAAESSRCAVGAAKKNVIGCRRLSDDGLRVEKACLVEHADVSEAYIGQSLESVDGKKAPVGLDEQDCLRRVQLSDEHF